MSVATDEVSFEALAEAEDALRMLQAAKCADMASLPRDGGIQALNEQWRLEKSAHGRAVFSQDDEVLLGIWC